MCQGQQLRMLINTFISPDEQNPYADENSFYSLSYRMFTESTVSSQELRNCNVLAVVCSTTCICALVFFNYMYMCSGIFNYMYMCSGIFNYMYMCSGIFSYMYMCSGIFNYMYMCSGIFNYMYMCSGIFNYMYM